MPSTRPRARVTDRLFVAASSPAAAAVPTTNRSADPTLGAVPPCTTARARSHRARVVALVVPLLAAGNALGADDKWALCGAGPQVPARPDPEAAETDTRPGAIHLSADRADVSEEGISKLIGNVVAAKGSRQLRSDEITYTPDVEVIDARGNVRLWDEGVFVSGDTARAELETDVTSIGGATTYVLEDLHAHGRAAEISTVANERLTASDVTYTTCDPDDPDWSVTARHVEFDRTEDVGTVRSGWLEFRGQRVLYTPWVSFPLSGRRKSGLLPPTWGVDGSNGVGVTTPYYFNLAPNYDATLAAQAMSERGVQTEGEFRFLHRSYGTGRATARYLPHDRVLDDYRAAFDLAHRHRWSKRLSTNGRFEWISDSEYYEDFGANLSQSSQTHLPRRIDADYRGDGWTTRVRFEHYLTIDRTIPPASRPYARVPQILFRTFGAERNREINFGTNAEITYFENDARTSGGRADLRASVSYPMRAAGAFLVSKATLDVTKYALVPATGAALTDDAPLRALPILSVDSGMFLERPLALRAGI